MVARRLDLSTRGWVLPVELGGWQMTTDQVLVDQARQRRLLHLAKAADTAATAGVEHAAAGRIDRTRDLAFKSDALPGSTVQLGNRGQERLGVGVVRAGDYRVGQAHLHDPVQIPHGDPIGEVADDSDVVANHDPRFASKGAGNATRFVRPPESWRGFASR